jgi:hypothetical protein
MSGEFIFNTAKVHSYFVTAGKIPEWQIL